MATRAADIIVSAVTEFDGRALTKGSKQVSHFDAGVKKLAKTFVSLYSVSKIAQFGKASVAAFAADDKSIKSLGVTLRNTGNSFATDYVNKWIAGLEGVSAVIDDTLRPAFQTLLTTTGSVTQSQKALKLALDVAAGTGKDVGAVSSALAKGFNGQTTALTKLGAGLKKTTIASGDMNKIMAELQAKFSGQALTAASTYAGKMDKLKIATENAKEVIGKGLVDALSSLGDDASLTTLIDQMASLAQYTSDVITGLGKMTKGFTDFMSTNFPGTVKLLKWSMANSPLSLVAKLGAGVKPVAGGDSARHLSMAKDALYTKESAAAAAALKAKNKLTAIENAALLAKLKASGDAATLEALKAKFDVERIGITLAMNNATDTGTKLLLKSQLDLIDGNAKNAAADLIALQARDAALAESVKKSKENDALAKAAADALGVSFDQLNPKFDALGKAFITLADKANAAANAAQNYGERFNPGMTGATTNAPAAVWVAPPSGPGASVGVGGDQGAGGQNTQTQVIVLPTVVTDTPGFTDAVQTVVQNLNRMGSPLAGTSARGD